ncbi:MAG: ParB/RepB/Spo0J family partition protein [Clostridia bacterium]|nr:ParB/RepB/Spo0J family partition protein [Clostridia bacterium]
MKKSGLGRGLDALLPELEEEPPQDDQTTLSIHRIDTNPDQPRKNFSEESLRQLAESIATAGILQPILVVRRGDRFRIVAGERRFRAARMAGLTEVPVIVRDLTEEQQMEIALIENLQREDLNPIEESEAIKNLMDKCGYTQEQAARRLGRSRPAVANSLRLLSLPEVIRRYVADGLLSAGHARVLCGIEDEERQLALCETTLRDGLNVRALEALASKKPVSPAGGRTAQPLSLELKDMQERLSSVFGVKAQISGSEENGRIILSYSSREELEAIYDQLERLEQ